MHWKRALSLSQSVDGETGCGSLGRITLRGKACSVQEKANDTNEINKRRERECKKVQKI